MTEAEGIDPVGLEVCRHSLIGAAEEMGMIMKRAAFSPMIKERNDRSCALFSPDRELVVQAEHLPIHLGLLVSTVPMALEAIAPDVLGPGDVSVHNDPYVGGSHLPDFTTIMPIYDGPTLLGYSAVMTHMTDVGGGAPGGVVGHAREIFEEGLRVPPCRLYRRGQLCADVLNIIKSNVRVPTTMGGDLLAQAAANFAGERRCRAIASKFGHERLLGYMRQLVRYSELRTRRAIAELPDGTYEFEDYLDDDGNSDEPVRINVRVEIRRDEVIVDFTGSAPQRNGPINAALAVVKSSVYFVLRCLIDPTIPTNSGCFKPVEVIAPEGTVVNSRLPAPVGGGSLETAQRLVDVLLGAFAQAVPERVPAAGMGSHNSIAFGGWDRQRNEPFVITENLSGGWGARATKDGLSTTRVNLMNTPNNPVEVIEREAPLTVARVELRDGSGGDGRHRGGLGIVKEYVLGEEMRVGILSDRHRFRPWGLFGGEPGTPSEHVVIVDGNARPLPSKTTTTIPAGGRLVAKTAGGGGYGRPAGKDESAAGTASHHERVAAGT